jgi:hypothetical protein
VISIEETPWSRGDATPPPAPRRRRQTGSGPGVFHGKHMRNGWKNAGLPWGYDFHPDLMWVDHAAG